MRKITELAVSAFNNNENFKRDNTEVEVIDGDVVLFLHGNCIATKNIYTGKTRITNAGWSSNTTKERLNGLWGVSINQKNWEWFLNGEAWNGDWITI